MEEKLQQSYASTSLERENIFNINVYYYIMVMLIIVFEVFLHI